MLCLFEQITKEVASKSGIEYSNFVKSCKMRKDLQVSTYLKCASGFGKDVIILHLPKGLVESMVELRQHHHKRYYTIEQQELFLILHKVLLREVKLPNFFEVLLSSLIEKDLGVYASSERPLKSRIGIKQKYRNSLKLRYLLVFKFLFTPFTEYFQRREGDSNSRYPFGVYTLSRRAS